MSVGLVRMNLPGPSRVVMAGRSTPGGVTP